MNREVDQALRDVVRAAGLWHIWVRLGVQDVRLKFRRSVVGPAWIFLNLAVLVVSIGFIYANLLGQDAREFVPYLTIGLILWGYLTNSIVDGGNAFIHSEGYIKQISLPIYVYIFRSFVSIGLTSLDHVVRVRHRRDHLSGAAGAGDALRDSGTADHDDHVAAADHDLRALERALPRRRAHRGGRHAGALLRDAGDLSGHDVARRAATCATSSS